MLNSPGLQECRLLSVLPVSQSINFPEKIRVWNCRWQNKYLASFGIFFKNIAHLFSSPSLVEFLFDVSRERALVVAIVKLLLGRELRVRDVAQFRFLLEHDCGIPGPVTSLAPSGSSGWSTITSPAAFTVVWGGVCVCENERALFLLACHTKIRFRWLDF